MSIDIIRERLGAYACQDADEEAQAIREISQEIVLGALSRASFFTHAAFHGGTCLRILAGLRRFSEDLDFMLKRPDPSFTWAPFLKGMTAELAAYGYDMELKDRPQEGNAVKKAFVKDGALIKSLRFEYLGARGVAKKINIKLEVDTNPPPHAGFEVRYLKFPQVAPVTIQDEGTLFAGKLHALLCREHAKGRDWYDFIWYVDRGKPINLPYLIAALRQTGPWAGTTSPADGTWVRKELVNKIDSLDWIAVRDDVRAFIRRDERDSLNHWDSRLFHSLVDDLATERFTPYRTGP